MTSTLPDLSRVTLNEIIFEGRNQAYGAFELRRVYDTHLKQATALTILLCLLAISTPFVIRQFAVPEEVPVSRTKTDHLPDIIFSDEPIFEPVVPVVQTPPPPSNPVSTQSFVPPRIVANTDPVQTTDQPTMTQLNTTEVGATTVVGDPGAVAVIEVAPTPATSSTSTEEIFTMTQEMPSYPGGYGELLKYLGKNIKYPALALRNSVEGKVYVKFVVDETGQVVNPVVLKGIGGGCDEEALRVVRGLPRFTPGMQNGRAVKVYFNLPIAFKMVN
jgi:periplasmic protein TonB